MDIKDLKLELSLNFKLIDLQDEMKSAKQNPKSVDKIIRDIADIGARLIDNRANYILKAKDDLTLDQKKTVVADDINDVKRLSFMH